MQVVAVVTEAWPRTPPECILVSGVVAEPHHAGPTLLGSPIKEGAMVTNDRDDIPENTTVTG